MKPLHELFVSPFASIAEAVRILDRGGAQIALITSEDARLLGTLTDGDIRRALLRGISFSESVETIMHRGFRALPVGATETEALAVMRGETLHQIPVLDDQGRVVRLFRLEDLIKLEFLPNPVVLMAGGEGRRLRPLTHDCPKPMLRVGDRPLLEIILQQCIDAGFNAFFIAVNYLKDQIIDHFRDGARWGVSIRYLEESQPLGTAGALGLLPERPNAPVLVMNGDVLTRVDFRHLLRFHAQHAAAATLCVREHATQIPYGVARLQDTRLLGLEEKPILSHYVNAGIYLLDPDLLALIPAGQRLDMPQLLTRALEHEHAVHAFPIHEYWLDVGHPETFEQAHAEW